MSLDVYLVTKRSACEHCGRGEESLDIFNANITHNLNTMAREAGIYYHLWRPDEIGITQAKELIEPIQNALVDMKARPDHYKQFNASNGWGLYEHFVPWIEEYLQACIKNPEAMIEVSR